MFNNYYITKYYEIIPFIAFTAYLVIVFFKYRKRIKNLLLVILSCALPLVVLFLVSIESGIFHDCGNIGQDRMYIGQTRDGLPDGRGYEYDGDGRLRLKGHFKSGLPDGNVTEYTRDGIKIYEGQMIEGKRNGTGKLWEYNDDGSVYSLYYGSFSDDKKSGYGLSTVYKYGDIVSRYEGGYYGGYRTGFGINEYEIENTGEKHIYCGNFHNGYLYGYGVIYDSSHQLLKSGFFKEDKLEQPLKPEEFEEPAGELEKYKCPAVTIWD